MVKKIVVRVYRDGVELVVVEYVVAGSRTAVRGLSSEVRDPVVVGT